MARSLLVTVATAALVAGCASGSSELPVRATGTVVAAPVPPVASPPAAVAVLRSWDAARARAWARGDAGALASLYVAGSPAGTHDAAMLGSWTARGLRVTGLATQLLAVEELGRTPARWRLRVTDRLAGGTAVGAGVRRALPVDRASTHVVVLQREAGAWRVASVE